MSAFDYFRSGGWSMWFILLFGVIAVSAAGRFAFRGVLALERFSRQMIASTLFASGFGFVMGMIMVSRYIVERTTTTDQRFAILIEGTGEASSNLAMGFLLSALASLLLSIGQRRAP
jgi:hypothetical protein